MPDFEDACGRWRSASPPKCPPISAVRSSSRCELSARPAPCLAASRATPSGNGGRP
jgi:hypothetical protein